MLTSDEPAEIAGGVKDADSVALAVMPADKVSQALKPGSKTTMATGASTSSNAELTQGTVMTFAVKGGVLISAQASGTGVTSSDLAAAEALLTMLPLSLTSKLVPGHS